VEEEIENSRATQTVICQEEKQSQTDDAKFRGPILSIHKFRNDPTAVSYYTGLTDYSHFSYLFCCLGPAAYYLTYKCHSLDQKNELFLCLMKLRQAKDDIELGILFNISRATASRVFLTWLNFLFYQFKEIGKTE
jgi:hypothetical protein